jgi:hypothetical protein
MTTADFPHTETARRNGFWTWVIGGVLIAIGMVFTAIVVLRKFESSAPTGESATIPVEAR